MTNLEDLIKTEDMLSVSKLIENEIKNNKEPIKTQKKQIIIKLNELFDGYFLDGFERKTYGNFLSRALTAYVISNMFGVDSIEAAQYITDDANDYGIDALYYSANKIYVFQTKFSANVSTNDLRVVKDGISKLLDLQNNLTDFNLHFTAHRESLYKYLLNGETKIVPVCIFFGDTVSKELETFYANEVTNKRRYGDFIDNCIFVTKTDIFNYDINPPKITAEFILDNFFFVSQPIRMYCGCAKASFLKSLFVEHRNNLFSKNIRFAVSNSLINFGIQNTIEHYPEKLLYYHNGITFICDSIKEKPISATSTTIKNLDVNGLSIVNGAQTISSLSQLPMIADNAFVQIRLIETDDVNVATKITQYNNSQNAVSDKDLRTLDPIHKRIKFYFLQNGYHYTYRTGENLSFEKKIDFEDLMIGLACYYGFARTAKINKGQLWKDEKLYNDLLKLENLQLFLEVARIKKIVDSSIKNIADFNQVILHYNRLILEIIFKKYSSELNKLSDAIINKEVQDIFNSICTYVQEAKQNIAIYHRNPTAYSTIAQYCLGTSSQHQPIQQMLL